MLTASPPDGAPTMPAIVGPATERTTARLELARFSGRVAAAVLVSLLILALAYVLWRGAHVLLLAFAGMLVAIFLSSLAVWTSRRTGLSYKLSLTVVLLALLGVSVGLVYFMATSLAPQMEDLVRQLPASFERVEAFLRQYSWGEYLLEQAPPPNEVIGQVAQFSRLTGLLSGVADVLVSAVVILTVGIFGAANPGLYREGVLHLVPLSRRTRARETAEALAFNLRWWLLGQFFLMVVIGVTTTIGLTVIGVPLAITLGLIAGILEIVPYIGPWLSGVPAVLIALPLGPGPVLLTVGLYLALHILEGYILLPLVQQKAVHLPPALTLVMQALMGTLMGLMGLFVAAPLTVAAVILVKMLYVKDTLGDPAGESEKPVVVGVR